MVFIRTPSLKFWTLIRAQSRAICLEKKYSKAHYGGMKKIDWTPTLFLFLTPLAALVFVPLYLVKEGWHWSLFFIFAALWAVTELSITAGYHRFLSHRSYSASTLMKVLYLLFGAGAFQASALKWG